MTNPHRIVEVSAITGFLTIEAFLAWRVCQAAQGLDWCSVGLGLLAGYIAADFMSGLIHWGFDRYGTVNTPIVGQHYVKPFREHHVDEKAITLHDFVETNGNNSVATSIVLLPALAVPLHTGATISLFAVPMLAGLALAVFGTNQFHKWSHVDQPPAIVAFLQRAHLILGVQHHQVHHTPPFDRYYCITTGWLNPVLDKLRFFARLEGVVLALTGVRAGEDDSRQTRHTQL